MRSIWHRHGLHGGEVFRALLMGKKAEKLAIERV